MRLEYRFQIQDQWRTIKVESTRGDIWALTVPRLLGGIRRAERRGRYFVVHTDGGRVSYHIDDGSALTGWWQRGCMHWQSMRQTFGAHCLCPGLDRRVQFVISDRRDERGVTVVGRIIVDKRTVYITPGGRGAKPLASAVAELLHAEPSEALESANPLAASLALIDRRVSQLAVERADPRRFELPLWARLRRLRLTNREPAAVSVVRARTPSLLRPQPT